MVWDTHTKFCVTVSKGKGVFSYGRRWSEKPAIIVQMAAAGTVTRPPSLYIQFRYSKGVRGVGSRRCSVILQEYNLKQTCSLRIEGPPRYAR